MPHVDWKNSQHHSHFCIYCQRGFKDLVRHIKRMHKGTYAYQSFVVEGKKP